MDQNALTPANAVATVQGTNPPFHWPVRIYWEDTDAGGIVYHARYLHFFERARTEWLRQLGVDQSVMKHTTGGMFVVQSLQMRYQQPAYLDELLDIHTYLIALGKASCTMRQTVSRQGDVLGSFEVRLGFIRAVDATPMRLPASVYDVMTPLLIQST